MSELHSLGDWGISGTGRPDGCCHLSYPAPSTTKEPWREGLGDRIDVSFLHYPLSYQHLPPRPPLQLYQWGMGLNANVGSMEGSLAKSNENMLKTNPAAVRVQSLLRKKNLPLSSAPEC